jgi:DNA ligase D-like protein (predicted 3'-phosphoesterase)
MAKPSTPRPGSLGRYRAMRDLGTSGEPRGSRARTTTGRPPRFVIHKHAASSLHYDLRLEAGGVLKSWAVPKGPSTDPRERRLAVEVEDHPLEYAGFEGVIEGGYGAGAVIVWDAGTYRTLTDGPVEAAVAAGHLSVWLDGRKLRGGWTLQRTRGGQKPHWLLIKRRDEMADVRRRPLRSEPASVLSGRTIEELTEKT